MKFSLLLLALLLAIGPAKAQLVINEFSQGNSGTREYFELVVTGTRTCTDSTADIRGWVFDDHNGWYGGSGTGIAAGHLRFANSTVWQSVPYGSVILLYNASDKNTSVSLADDPTDANHDYIYVIPVSSSSSVIEGFSGLPSSPSSPTFTYPTTGYSSGSNTWNYLGLANTGGDGVILASPANLGTAAHSVIFFTPGAPPAYQVPSVQLSNVGAGKNAYLTSAAYNSAAAWTIGNAGTDETPGGPNTTANAAWINGMRTLTPIAPSTITASICSGDSYFFGNASRTTAGSYTYTFTTAGGCDSTVTLNLAVNPRPVISGIAVTQPSCAGNDGSLAISGLTATTTYTVSYSLNGGPAVSQSLTTNAGGVLTVPGLGAGSYSNITVTRASCGTTNTGPYVLTSTAPPAAPVVTTNAPVCTGGTLNLSTPAVSGATYSWTGPNSFSSGANAPAIASVTNAAAGTYSLSITVGGCASATTTVSVAINPTPAKPVVTTNAPVCAGDTLRLFAASDAGAAYSWTGPGGFSSGVQSPVRANTAAAMSGYYRVIASLGTCSSLPDSVSALIKPLPVTPVLTGNSPVCTGDTIRLSVNSPVAGVTYTWSGPNAYSATGGNVAIAATAAAAGTYSVTAAQNGCSSATSGTIAVIVNPRPALTGSTFANPTTCNGSNGSITLNGLVAGTTYTVAYTKNGAPQTATVAAGAGGTLVFSGLTAGTYVFTGITASGCTSAPVPPITLSDPAATPAPTASANAPVCEGNTLQLNAAGIGGATYTWTGPNGFSATSGTPSIPNVTSAAAGAYSVTQTINGCTSAADSIVVIVNTRPATPAPANNGPICSGATLSLSTPAVAGAVYSWSGPAGFTSAAQNPSIPNATTAASGQYRVTVTVGTCVSAPGFTTAAVSQTPATPVAGSNSPVCVGNTLTLTAASATAGATYTWNGPNSFTSTQQNPSIANVTPAAAGTYTVTTQLGTCSAPAVTTTVAVTPIPGAPTPATPLVYCQGIVAPPLSAAGTGLRFYTDSVGGTGVATLSPSTATAGIFTYYVSQAANGCEGPRAKITVTINPKPAPPVTATSLTYCQFSVAAPLAATGTNVRWYATATGNTPLAAAPTPNTTTPGTFNYYVSQQPADCESDRLQVTVVVNAKPAPPTVQNPLFLCQNDSVQLTANGQNLRWYLHPTGGGGIAHLSPPTGTVDSFTYYVTQTVDGCESDRSRLQVYVNYKPNGIILASRPWLCSGDTISFTYYGNARADAEYNWKIPPYSVAVSGGGAGPYVVRYDSAGRQYVQLTINNMGCLSDVFEQPVEVRSHPDLRFVLQEAGCVDEPVNVALSGITTGIDSYSWDFGGGTILYSTATGGPYGIRWSGAGTKVVTVVATSRTCGSQPYRDTIEIHPNPDARISRVGGGVVCSGDSVELSVENEAGSTYVWSPYQYFTDRARMASTVYATPTLSGKIGVVVTSAKGCTSTDSIYIETKPCCEVYFPNAFSPNGDGKNDVFRAVTAGHHDVATFRVINRWGQVVYESKDERRGWDGTFNGRDQDAGTFYYYVKYRCSESGDYLEQKGEVILMR